MIDRDLLLRAYAMGIFPMADSRDDADIFWVEPEQRAVLPLDGFHLSRSLKKTLLQDRFYVTADRAFAEVVTLCAQSAPDRPSTWISEQIEKSYAGLHRTGHAHSIEIWQRDPGDGGIDPPALVGGLYGVSLGGAFFGESMASRARDASKVALAYLVARLGAGGFALLDCQFLTDHLVSLGAVEISRDEYRLRLYRALKGVAEIPPGASLPPDAPLAQPEFDVLEDGTPGKSIVQLLTKMS